MYILIRFKTRPVILLWRCKQNVSRKIRLPNQSALGPRRPQHGSSPPRKSKILYFKLFFQQPGNHLLLDATQIQRLNCRRLAALVQYAITYNLYVHARLLLDIRPLFTISEFFYHPATTWYPVTIYTFCVNTLLQFDAQLQLTLSVLKPACYFSPGQYFQFLC